MNGRAGRRWSEQRLRLFQPEAILPEQHYEMHRRPLTPEQRLMIAVLEEGITSFQLPRGRGGRNAQKIRNDAETWLRSRDTTWPFSFQNICDALNIEAGCLRRWLLRRRSDIERRLAGSSPKAA